MLELSRTEWSSVLELCNGVGLEQLWDSNGMKLKDDSDQLSALVGSCISSESDGQMINRVGSTLGDLKLVSDKGGHLYGPAMTKLIIKDPKPKPSTFMVSPSSSRRLVNTSDHHHHQKVSCLVDGCKADLNRCREYHRRHRVCELHSKTPVVIIRGQQKRFCQQCSRFHSLVEFDEVKRSCRKRLSGHNQRRRKPKPESLYFTSNNFLSNSKGPRILQFGSPQLCASTNVSNMWPAEAKSGQWLHAIDQRSAPKPFNGGDKQFFFLQRNEPKAAGSYQAAPQAFMCQPLPKTAASPAESRRGSYTTRASIDSGCALYLLSSHPTQNSVTVPNHLVQSNVTHPAGQLLDYSRLQMNCSDQFSSSHDVVDKPVNPEMMFLMGPDHGLLENGAQMLPIFL